MEAIEHGMEMTQEEGLFLEATLFGVCCSTEDMREGTRAFLEKRAAQFHGKVASSASHLNPEVAAGNLRARRLALRDRRQPL